MKRVTGHTPPEAQLHRLGKGSPSMPCAHALHALRNLGSQQMPATQEAGTKSKYLHVSMR
jgi:hypothetical protein